MTAFHSSGMNIATGNLGNTRDNNATPSRTTHRLHLMVPSRYSDSSLMLNHSNVRPTTKHNSPRPSHQQLTTTSPSIPQHELPPHPRNPHPLPRHPPHHPPRRHPTPLLPSSRLWKLRTVPTDLRLTARLALSPRLQLCASHPTDGVCMDVEGFAYARNVWGTAETTSVGVLQYYWSAEGGSGWLMGSCGRCWLRVTDRVEEVGHKQCRG